MSTREERKRAELVAKLASVSDEVKSWRRAVTTEDRLQKHCSQVVRIARELEPLVTRVRRAVEHADIGRTWMDLEAQVLDLHRVWGYYRDKLVLRRLEYADHLLLADEFAWACYEPAQRSATAAGDARPQSVREPPLVYLTAVASPFSLPRGTSIAGEIGSDPLSTRAARALVERLPLPVVGLPWFQLRHLPDALMLGHEVGHLVLDEFVTLPVVRDLVGAALHDDPAARRRWRAWAEEAFADVYGVLAGGPAYVCALADFLLVSGSDHLPGGRGYPAPATRVALAEAALDLVLPHEGTRSRDKRTAEGGAVTTPVDLAQAAAVAQALVAGPYSAFGPDRGVALTCVLPCEHLRAAYTEARDLLAGWVPATMDVRMLLATGAAAFATDPAGFEAKGVADKVLRRARLIQQPGTRYRGGSDWGVEDAVLAAADEARVDDLYALLAAG